MDNNNTNCNNESLSTEVFLQFIQEYRFFASNNSSWRYIIEIKISGVKMLRCKKGLDIWMFTKQM